MNVAAMQKTIDGVRLGFDDTGRGIAVVLLHGFLLNRSIWEPQAAALAQRSRVIRVDLRGSGESGGGDGPALMETLAGDVYGLLDALDVERAIVAGHGLGGYVALAFFRMYAERVAGLGLVASGPGADSEDQRAGRAALATAIERDGIEPAIDAYFERSCAAGGSTDPHRAALRAIMTKQSVPGAVAQLIGLAQRVDCSDLLEDIAVPTTIVAGEHDGWQPVADAARTAAAIAGAQLVRLPGIGHVPMLEAPAPTTAALAGLLDRAEQRRG